MFLNMAAVREVLLCLQPASIWNLGSVFPVQLSVPYFVKESQKLEAGFVPSESISLHLTERLSLKSENLYFSIIFLIFQRMWIVLMNSIFCRTTN